MAEEVFITINEHPNSPYSHLSLKCNVTEAELEISVSQFFFERQKELLPGHPKGMKFIPLFVENSNGILSRLNLETKIKDIRGDIIFDRHDEIYAFLRSVYKKQKDIDHKVTTEEVQILKTGINEMLDDICPKYGYC